MSLACGMRAVQFVFFLAIFSRHPGGVRVILKEAKAQKMDQIHPSCGQCGRPAICSVNGVNLCVDCYSRLQSANAQKSRGAMAMVNFLLDQADSITGLGGLYPTPRIKLPPPPKLSPLEDP